MCAGRLSKGSQPSLLLDGRQLGPIAKLVPLAPPLRPPARSTPDDAARALFFQVPGEDIAANTDNDLACQLGSEEACQHCNARTESVLDLACAACLPLSLYMQLHSCPLL